MEGQRRQPDNPGDNEPGVSLADIEMDIDPQFQPGETFEEATPTVNGVNSAYAADDEASAQPSQESRGGRGQRRRRCRCGCGCEACFCNPQLDSPLDSLFDMDLSFNNVGADPLGLGLDFFDMMDMETGQRERRERTPRQYRPPPWDLWGTPPSDPPAYRLPWRFSNSYLRAARWSPEFGRAEYPHMVFHRHDHRHHQHYHDNQGNSQNQQRGMMSAPRTSPSNNAIVMGQLTHAASCFLDFLHFLATLIILYGAFRLYFSSLPLNDVSPL